MPRAAFALLLFGLITVGATGCGGKPDPRDHPDFHHETLKDPGKAPGPPGDLPRSRDRKAPK